VFNSQYVNNMPMIFLSAICLCVFQSKEKQHSIIMAMLDIGLQKLQKNMTLEVAQLLAVNREAWRRRMAQTVLTVDTG